ncbi:MAG: metallophosphoesterase, partial [Intestinibacter sp.]|nr:metallophosphoesterase [Intestinibacter sp.]
QKYEDYLDSIEDADAVETTNTRTVTNPEGILYMTANSASGSKYYDLVEKKQAYIASRWQEDVPTYSIIDVTDTTFTINTYRTDNNRKIDSSFTIKKTNKKTNKKNNVNHNNSNHDNKKTNHEKH